MKWKNKGHEYDDMEKIYNLVNSKPPKISKTDALKLLYLVSDGKTGDIVEEIRGWFFNTGSKQEKHIQFIEELITEALKE